MYRKCCWAALVDQGSKQDNAMTAAQSMAGASAALAGLSPRLARLEAVVLAQLQPSDSSDIATAFQEIDVITQTIKQLETYLSEVSGMLRVTADADTASALQNVNLEALRDILASGGEHLSIQQGAPEQNELFLFHDV